MKAILEFNLPEERAEYEMHSKAADYVSILCSLRDDLRNIVKYGDRPEAEQKMASEIYDRFWALCEEFDVNGWNI